MVLSVSTTVALRDEGLPLTVAALLHGGTLAYRVYCGTRDEAVVTAFTGTRSPRVHGQDHLELRKHPWPHWRSRGDGGLRLLVAFSCSVRQTLSLCSLYSDSPLSSRPPLVSVGDATSWEDTREDFGLYLQFPSTTYFCKVFFFFFCVVAKCATSPAGRHARSSRESRGSCFQLPDLLGKVQGQRVTLRGHAGPRATGARTSGIMLMLGPRV